MKHLVQFIILLCVFLGGTVKAQNGNVQADMTTGLLWRPSSLFTNATNVSTIASSLSATFQPLDSDLTAIAAVSTSAYGRSFLALADSSAARTLTGTVIGTDVQAYDSDLAAVAALTTTSYGRSFLALADAAAARTLVGLSSSDSPTFTSLTLTGNLNTSDGFTVSSAGSIALTAAGTNENITLTPSGTGAVVVPKVTTATTDHSLIVGNTISLPTGIGRSKVLVGNTAADSELVLAQGTANGLVAKWSYHATPASAYAAIGTYAGSNKLVLQGDGGNVLLGTTTDSSNGKLQLATHTTKAGGIGFGTELSLYRSADSELRVQGETTKNTNFVIGTDNTGSLEASLQLVPSGSGANPGQFKIVGSPTSGASGYGSGTHFVSGGVRVVSLDTTGLDIIPTTASTSPTTGALTVGGGLGVAGKIHGGTEIVALNSSGSGLLGMRSSSGNASYIYWSETGIADRGILGFAGGSSKLSYRANASTFATGTEVFSVTSAGVGTFAGALTAGGTVASSTGLFTATTGNNTVIGTNGGTTALTVTTTQVNNAFTTEATTAGAGSLTTAGGIYAAKAIISNSSTASTNTTTGSIVTAGGAGIGGALNVGGSITTAGSVTAGGIDLTQTYQGRQVTDVLFSDGATSNRRGEATFGTAGAVAGMPVTFPFEFDCPTSNPAATAHIFGFHPTTGQFGNYSLQLHLDTGGSLYLWAQGASGSDSRRCNYPGFRAFYSGLRVRGIVVFETGNTTTNPKIYINGVDVTSSFTFGTGGTPPNWIDASFATTKFLVGHTTFSGRFVPHAPILGALTAAEVLEWTQTGRLPTWCEVGTGSAVAEYTSDFSAGTNSWINNGGAGTVTGNIDGILSVDDVLRQTATDTSAKLLERSIASQLGLGKHWRIDFDYYAEAGAFTGAAYFGQYASGTNSLSTGNLIVEGSWQTGYIIVQGNVSDGKMRIGEFQAATGASTRSMNNGFSLYFKNIKLRQLGPLAKWEIQPGQTVAKDYGSNLLPLTLTSGITAIGEPKEVVDNGSGGKTLAASGTNQNITLTPSGTGSVRLPSTVTSGIQLYNTADETTNYERLGLYWSGNQATIATTQAGSGTARSLVLSSGGLAGMAFGSSGAITYSSTVNTTAGHVKHNFQGAGSNALSGSNVGVGIYPTYNQASGTAANTDLLINRTETAVGSGSQNFILAQLGGSDRFRVANTGDVVTVGRVVSHSGYPALNRWGGSATLPTIEYGANSGTRLNTGTSTYEFVNGGTISAYLSTGGFVVTGTTASTSATTGAFTVAGGAGVNGDLNVAGYVVGKVRALAGTGGIATANRTGTLYTNEGAASRVDTTLPTAEAGVAYTFVVQDADGVRVTAAAGDTIRIAGTVTAAAGYIESATIGNTVTLVAINATEWVATASHGTWTFGP